MNTVEVDQIDLLQERYEALLTTVQFLHGDESEIDETTIRSMLVYGCTDEQIVKAFAITAVKYELPFEDRARYAFGVVRRLKTEADAPEWDPDEELP